MMRKKSAVLAVMAAVLMAGSPAQAATPQGKEYVTSGCSSAYWPPFTHFVTCLTVRALGQYVVLAQARFDIWKPDGIWSGLTWTWKGQGTISGPGFSVSGAPVTLHGSFLNRPYNGTPAGPFIIGKRVPVNSRVCAWLSELTPPEKTVTRFCLPIPPSKIIEVPD
jgi:hypothetical protein